MRCGISTACFYPKDTCETLQLLADAGVRVAEVFLNTFSEVESGYVRRLARIAQAGQMDIVAVHPFSSMLDGFFFASDYTTRYGDGLALYKRYFEVCAELGARHLVFHGDHKTNALKFSAEKYAAHFHGLAALGREYGVTLCHENIAYCRLDTPEAVRELRPLLGADAAFTLDVKQTRRGGAPLAAMADAMAGAVRHVHISDHTEKADCLPPGTGNVDYAAFLAQLAGQGFAGDLIIELYIDNYAGLEDLLGAKGYVENLLQAQQLLTG